MRQVLPAIGFRRRQAVPAAGNPVVVEVPPALRRLDCAADEPRPSPVTCVAKRRHLFRGEAPGLAKDRIHQVLAQLAECAAIDCLGQAGHMLQGECDLVDRCLVHDDPPWITVVQSAWPTNVIASKV